MHGPINVTSKNIECGTKNAVTFEWYSPTNLMETGLSHYEVLLMNSAAELVKTINVTNTSLIFALDDGMYTVSVTAENKCGERSETISSVFNINNGATACTRHSAGKITSLQVGIAVSLFIGILFGIVCTLIAKYIIGVNKCGQP